MEADAGTIGGTIPHPRTRWEALRPDIVRSRAAEALRLSRGCEALGTGLAESSHVDRAPPADRAAAVVQTALRRFPRDQELQSRCCSALTNLTDAGMLPSRYAGRASALKIDGDVLTAVHLDCLKTLVEIP